MGNKILIIVIVSFTIIVGIFLSIRGRVFGVEDENTQHYNQLQANNIANSGLQLALNRLRFNKYLRGTYSANLHGGTYTVKITGDSILSVTVTSNFNKKKGLAKVTLVLQNINIPQINSSLAVTTSNLNLNLHGNILISGFDRNPNGTAGTGSPLYGIAVERPQDSARIMSSISNQVRDNVIGLGGIPSIGVVPSQSNIHELISQLIQSADTILYSGTYTSGTVLGTLDNPKITFVQGDVNFAGNASGSGILVVYGDLTCAGNFSYNGLVIVYGNTSISASASGNSAIYGGMFVIGPSVNISATGSAIVNYSSSVIQNIRTRLKSSRFIVKDWWT